MAPQLSSSQVSILKLSNFEIRTCYLARNKKNLNLFYNILRFFRPSEVISTMFAAYSHIIIIIDAYFVINKSSESLSLKYWRYWTNGFYNITSDFGDIKACFFSKTLLAYVNEVHKLSLIVLVKQYEKNVPMSFNWFIYVGNANTIQTKSKN